jgi:hypothetical protein
MAALGSMFPRTSQLEHGGDTVAGRRPSIDTIGRIFGTYARDTLPASGDRIDPEGRGNSGYDMGTAEGRERWDRRVRQGELRVARLGRAGSSSLDVVGQAHAL